MPSEAAIRAAQAINEWEWQTVNHRYGPAGLTHIAEIIDREFARGPIIVTPNDPAKAAAARLLELAINHVLAESK